MTKGLYFASLPLGWFLLHIKGLDLALALQPGQRSRRLPKFKATSQPTAAQILLISLPDVSCTSSMPPQLFWLFGSAERHEAFLES